MCRFLHRVCSRRNLRNRSTTPQKFGELSARRAGRDFCQTSDKGSEISPNLYIVKVFPLRYRRSVRNAACMSRLVIHSGGVTSLSESDFLVTPFITSTTCFREQPTGTAGSDSVTMFRLFGRTPVVDHSDPPAEKTVVDHCDPPLFCDALRARHGNCPPTSW